ncbi:MAG: hypothetical protein ABFD97_11605 [Syntrophobacter sp.]
MNKGSDLMSLYDTLYYKCHEYLVLRNVESEKARVACLKEQISSLYRLLRSMNAPQIPLKLPK